MKVAIKTLKWYQRAVALTSATADFLATTSALWVKAVIIVTSLAWAAYSGYLFYRDATDNDDCIGRC